MKFLVFAVSVLAVVLAVVRAERDPISICSPDIYETNLYDFNSSASGLHAVDWTRNTSVVNFVQSGLRLIYNMTSMTGYKILPNGKCTSFNLDPIQIPIRCLPANAVRRYNQTTSIGPVGQGGVNILSYDVPITPTSRVRTYFTDTTPVYPIIRELIGGSSQFSGSVVLFTNPRVTTSPSPLLTIPSACP